MSTEHGLGEEWRYNRSWMNSLTCLATGIAAGNTGMSGDTVTGMVTGSIWLTGMKNPAYGILHLFVEITNGPASGVLLLWIRPYGLDKFFLHSRLNIENKPGGQHFEVLQPYPGEWRIGMPETDGGGVTYDIWSAYSE